MSAWQAGHLIWTPAQRSSPAMCWPQVGQANLNSLINGAWLWQGQQDGPYKGKPRQARPRPGALVEVGAGSLLTEQEEPIPACMMEVRYWLGIKYAAPWLVKKMSDAAWAVGWGCLSRCDHPARAASRSTTQSHFIAMVGGARSVCGTQDFCCPFGNYCVTCWRTQQPVRSARSCSLAKLRRQRWSPNGLSRTCIRLIASVDNDCYENASHSFPRSIGSPGVGSVWSRVGATLRRHLAMAAGNQ